MDLHLHLPTLLLLSMAMNLMVGGLLWAVYRLRERQPCFRLWSMACAAFVVGTLLASLRAYVAAPLVTVFVAHLLLAFSPLLVLMGIHRLLGFPAIGSVRTARTLIIAGTVYVVGLTVSFAETTHLPRLLTALFSTIIFSLAIYRLNRSSRTPRMPFRILQVIFGVHGTLMMLQVLVIATGHGTLVALDVDTVLAMILVHHLLLATATVMALPLLAFTQAERDLRTLAEHDELTKLLNRRAFFQQGLAAFANARQHRHSLTVLMIDLDYFKQINDRWGHEVGDSVLQHVARIMTEELRDGDIIGRIGGEEFAAVLNTGSREEVKAITNRLLHKIAERAFLVEGKPLSLSASIGGVAISPSIQSFHEMMRLADAAMYQAKENGRNRMEFVPASN